MNFNEFFISTESLSIDFSKKEENDINSEGLLKNEALFQLPLICLIVLLLAKDKRKPFILEIGQIVGECIDGSFYGFKGSAQHLGWSANLRIRTIKAVNFLEATKLIEVNIKNKKLLATDLGVKVINNVMGRDDMLAYNLSKISLSYRNYCISRNLNMELWDEVN
jgi:hypothetical protein